jgi:hypothetical protein
MATLDKLDDWGPLTVLLCIVVAIVLLVGGAVCVVNPDTLTFAQYLDDLKTFGLAVAGLGVGRGIHGAAKTLGDAHVSAAAIASPQQPHDLDVDLAEDEEALDEDELDVQVDPETGDGQRPEAGQVPAPPDTA